MTWKLENYLVSSVTSEEEASQILPFALSYQTLSSHRTVPVLRSRKGWKVFEGAREIRTIVFHEPAKTRDHDRGPDRNRIADRHGPDRRRAGRIVSIRKNIVLPGYGPSGLHYGKNGYVLSGVERSGPPGGGPARVAQTGAGGRGGSAGQTNRHGESADQEILIRRDVGDEPAVVSNGGV